jgi:hypothetical protein
MKRPATEPAPDDLETSTDDAIAACGGDARAAVRVLLVTVDQLQAEVSAMSAEIAALAVNVSRGYSRGRRDRYLVRTKVTPPDGA